MKRYLLNPYTPPRRFFRALEMIARGLKALSLGRLGIW